MNKIIKSILMSIVGLLLFVGCENEVIEEKNEPKENNVKINSNEGVIKDQELEAFKFTNTSLIYENGNSILETKVTNTSNETEYLAEFKIYVRDKNGNEIVTMKGFVGDSIKAGETKIITSTYSEDLTDATSIDYEIIRENIQD